MECFYGQACQYATFFAVSSVLWWNINCRLHNNKTYRSIIRNVFTQMFLCTSALHNFSSLVIDNVYVGVCPRMCPTVTMSISQSNVMHFNREFLNWRGIYSFYFRPPPHCQQVWACLQARHLTNFLDVLKDKSLELVFNYGILNGHKE